MKGTTIENGVIEVWPGESGRYDYTYNASILPSVQYDYTILTDLTPHVSFKLHLKPGVRIRYQPQKNTAPYLFDCDGANNVSGKANSIIVTVTSDVDRTSSIECITKNGYVTNLASVTNGALLSFQGVTLYVDPIYPAAKTLPSPCIVGNTSELRFNDCLYVLFNKIQVDTQDTLPCYQIQQTETSVVEIINSDFAVFDHNSSTKATGCGHIYYEWSTNSGVPIITRIHNSRFINSSVYVTTATAKLNAFWLDANTPANRCLFTMDDCIFYIGRVDSDYFFDGNKGGYVFRGDATLRISYISRSIHNYNLGVPDIVTPLTYIEITGEAESLSSLGVPGYGMLEESKVVPKPFDF